MITSVHNPKIKWVRSLLAQARSRTREQAFVVEGVRLVEEALASDWPAKLLLFTADLSERGKPIVERYIAQGVPVEETSDKVMHSVSETDTPQGILAVLSWRPLQLPEELDFVLVPDAVRDPGNLGTMLRTAAAAGVDAAFLTPGTVDPWAPKVLRAGMGAHFRLPVQAFTWPALSDRLAYLKVFLAAPGGGLPYTQADFRSPMALIIGGEAEGVSHYARQLALTQVSIPMPGGGESLNAAVATAIILFEVLRQRAEK